MEQSKERGGIEKWGHWHVFRRTINVCSRTIKVTVQMGKEVQPQLRKRHIVQRKRTRQIAD